MSSTLKYLDLSYCLVGKGSALMHLESLEILILYDCTLTYPDVISTVCQLKKLRVLDLSRRINEDTGIIRETQDEDPCLLDQVVTKLPYLTRLDISGTSYIGSKDRNISVFEIRIDRPFEFLGLFHTGNDAAYRSCIPAITVAGEANESQILNACEAYMDRPEQLSKALNDLYNLYKTITPSETFNSVPRALDVVLSILTRHISDEQVVIYTTAALWCIVKINVTTKNLNDAKVRRTITSRLLDVMHYHKTNRIILINGGLTLLFLPDIICEHSRVASISLLMCQDEDPRTQGFGTTLLNTLACQVGGDQKIYIGELRAIETMTEIIKAKIKQNTCDEILETAWSTLWNITDETPVNCERFLLCDGFEAFEDCMDKFSFNKEVLRNIMGLLGNVAECKELRMKFMQARYIKRFESLLSSPIDGIECSYNACGILAHLISDGQEFWDQHLHETVSRQDVMDKMCAAINAWPINSRRNINYRSFEPIVRLLDLAIAPAAQYWAAFALLPYINMIDSGKRKLWPDLSNAIQLTWKWLEIFVLNQTITAMEQVKWVKYCFKQPNIQPSELSSNIKTNTRDNIKTIN
jgi:Zyg-11 family protein